MIGVNFQLRDTLRRVHVVFCTLKHRGQHLVEMRSKNPQRHSIKKKMTPNFSRSSSRPWPFFLIDFRRTWARPWLIRMEEPAGLFSFLFFIF